jgi:hypothetical protein
MSSTPVFNSQGNVAQYARKNLLINGDFRVWQRGDPITTAASTDYFADRWSWVFGTTDASKAYSSGIPQADVSRLDGGNTWQMQQSVELPAAGEAGVFQIGQKFMLTYEYKVSDGSLVGSTHRIRFSDSSNNDNEGTMGTLTTLSEVAGTDGFTVVKILIEVTDAPLAANTCANIRLGVAVDGTQTPGVTIMSIRNVQLELGPEATDFEYRPIAEELALCQRYYRTNYPTGTAPGDILASGAARTTGARNFAGAAAVLASILFEFPVAMRVTPTITMYSWRTGNSGVFDNNGTADVAMSVIDVNNKGVFLQPSASVAANNLVAGMYTADAEL